jgi:hypothetical protein
MKNILFSFFFIVAFAGQTNAQKTLSDFKSKQFKTAELTLGSGTRFLGSLTANLNLQKNIGRHFSVISYSYLDIKPYGRNPDKTYLAVKYLNLLQSGGIGSSIGKKWCNVGLYVLGGFRFHQSVEAVNGFHEASTTTRAVLPDAAFLLNLKIGRRKFYCASQFYYQLTPLDPATRVLNLTLGVGRRF